MGLIGNDGLGDIVMSQLQKHDVALNIRRTDRAGTAYGIVIAPPGTDRMFLEDPGCNGIFTAQDIDYGMVTKSRLFHFGYPTLMQSMFTDRGAELHDLLTRVRETGAATSLDTTLPDPASPAGKADWSDILTRILPKVDIFVPSAEEILYMMEPKQYADIISKAKGDILDEIPPDIYVRLGDRIMELGVSILMIKAGHRGAYLRTGDVQKLNATTPLSLPTDRWNHRDLWIPVFPADPARIKNACGAGDCAVAGFLTAILDGVDIEKAGRYAMLAGRDNLYGVDALSGLSDWTSMTDRIQKPA
jgi:sugar/nucleoside kinase (ribokinase family)